MNIIKILPSHEAQKIAAGEVVERPAHVVKELVENALDAGATSIFVHIHGNGIERIVVSDNGNGMSSDDARMCILNHATSKITSAQDLNQVYSFGFRGEALASIAAISTMRITTTMHEATPAIQLTITHGVVINEQHVSREKGTDIEITNLFENVPARKKFLKSTDTEWRHSIQFLHAIALAHPTISFKVMHNNAIVFVAPATSDSIVRYQQIFTQLPHTAFLPLSHDEPDIGTIQGFITNAQHVRYDRSQITILVNKRWVSQYEITKALLKAYQRLLPPARYPYAVIAITCDPSLVDVNTHPRKEEVRFVHARRIERAVTQAVHNTLETTVSVHIQPQPSVSRVQPYSPIIKELAAHVVPTKPEPTIPQHPPFTQSLTSRSIQEPVKQQHIIVPSIATKEDDPLLHHTIIGQWRKTYILVDTHDGLYVVDQHAAHERILYERFDGRFEQLSATQLLFPISIDISPTDQELITPYLPSLATFGITIEPFGTRQLLVTATPVCAPDLSVPELVEHIVHQLKQDQGIAQHSIQEQINHNTRAMMACKAAIKAGDELNITTMQQLLKDLQQCPNRFSCPHGRPTGWLLPTLEIEKKFRRRT